MDVLQLLPNNRTPARMAPLATLPVFWALAGKRAIVGGGSDAAAWKAELLLACGADVHVYAKELSDTFVEIINRGADAGEGRLFLEHYLDGPVETEIGARTGRPVARGSIVEVGNLASTDAGAARALIVAMTHQLHCQGLVWVTFTATRALLNSFARLRLAPSVLADADPARLGQAQGAWGSYYATHPQVMFGNIGFGHDQLAR